MSFRTEGVLKTAESLPTGESSINFAERSFSTEVEARNFFLELKRKLLNISHWNHRSGLSSYELFDSSGQAINDQAIKPASFIKITLAGSGKSDWVRVEDIRDENDELVITVRPSYDPTGQPQQTGKISHFFWNEATNNFCAIQSGEKVSLYVIGLNEKLNSDHTSGMVETVRNTAVANMGYYLGIQKSEWTKFCKSFLFDGEETAAE